MQYLKNLKSQYLYKSINCIVIEYPVNSFKLVSGLKVSIPKKKKKKERKKRKKMLLLMLKEVSQVFY